MKKSRLILKLIKEKPELTYEEIATIVGTTRQYVANVIYRHLQRPACVFCRNELAKRDYLILGSESVKGEAVLEVFSCPECGLSNIKEAILTGRPITLVGGKGFIKWVGRTWSFTYRIPEAIPGLKKAIEKGERIFPPEKWEKQQVKWWKLTLKGKVARLVPKEK